MSIAASMWAWQKKIDNPRHKLLLLKLADSANDEGFCWPKVKTLGSDCNMSKSTVTRATRALQDAGLLTIRERYRQDGSQGSNMYLLHVNGRVPDLEGEGVTADTGGVQQRDVPRTVREPSKEPNPSADAAPAEHITQRRWRVKSSRPGKGPFTADLDKMTCTCENRSEAVCRHLKAAKLAQERKDKSERRVMRDAVWDVLVELYGEPPTRGKVGRGGLVGSLVELLGQEVLPEPESWKLEVKKRHAALQQEWGVSRTTLRAFVENWSLAGKLVKGQMRGAGPRKNRTTDPL